MNCPEGHFRRGGGISVFKIGFHFHQLVQISPERDSQTNELGVGANVGETDKPAPVLLNRGHQPVDIRGVSLEEFLFGDFECFGCDVVGGKVFCGVTFQHSNRTLTVLFVSASLFLANLRVGISGEYRKFSITTTRSKIEDCSSRDDDISEVAIADDVFGRKCGVDVLVHAFGVGAFCGFVEVAEWEGREGQAVDVTVRTTEAEAEAEHTAHEEASHAG